MDNQIDFDINDALKHYLDDPAAIVTPEADGSLQDCENDPESLSGPLVNRVLNPIIDAIAEHPEALLRSSVFDSLQFFLKCAPNFLPTERSPNGETHSELFELSRHNSQLPAQTLSKLFDLIISGLSAQADIVNSELGTEDQDASHQQKNLLEMYTFLLQWSIAVVEVKAAEKPHNAPIKGRGAKVGKAKGTAKDGNWDSSVQLQHALDTICKVLKLKLSKVFVTTSERDTFVGLCTRPVYLILESEQRTKSTSMRMHAFKVICIATKHHGHAFGISLSSTAWGQYAKIHRGTNLNNSEPLVL